MSADRDHEARRRAALDRIVLGAAAVMVIASIATQDWRTLGATVVIALLAYRRGWLPLHRRAAASGAKKPDA